MQAAVRASGLCRLACSLAAALHTVLPRMTRLRCTAGLLGSIQGTAQVYEQWTVCSADGRFGVGDAGADSALPL